MRVWWHGDAIRVSGLLLEHMWAMVGHVKSAVFVLVTTMAIAYWSSFGRTRAPFGPNPTAKIEVTGRPAVITWLKSML